MEVAEGDEPAVAEADTAPPLSLAQRMSAVRKECAEVGKSTINMKTKAGVAYTIKAHTIEAVLAEIRPLFDRFDIDMTPNLVERSYSGNRCDVLIDFEFERLDDPLDRRTIRWAGAGTDDGDKGFSKAGTNALKEMLKKRFLITDRADAEDEGASVEHRPDEGATRKEVDDVKDQRRSAIEQWAKTFKSALEKSTNLKDIQRLERENKDQLASEDLPEVTRTFFIELIEDRKAKVAK